MDRRRWATASLLMPPDPYSRSYWRFPDEFPEVYADDRAYSLWCRLRDIADMSWPSAATLPYGVRKSALTALLNARERRAGGRMVEAPLIVLEPGNRYRIRGMDKHRTRRSESGKAGADARWGRSDRNANAQRPQSEGNANGMHIPSQEKKESQPVALRPEEQREHLDSLKVAMEDAGIPLPSKANGVEHKPYTDTDVIEHCRSVLADESAEPWKREAAKAQLEAMRVEP